MSKEKEINDNAPIHPIHTEINEVADDLCAILTYTFHKHKILNEDKYISAITLEGKDQTESEIMGIFRCIICQRSKK